MKTLTAIVAIPVALAALGVALLLYASKAFDDAMFAGATNWWEGEAP